MFYTRPILGRIELRSVFFRYAQAEPFVLEDINLSVQPGEFVTIMGPSGGGKTTLVKIMVGLLEPTSGEGWTGCLFRRSAHARSGSRLLR
jgi:ATP-binding cassette subfamily B protein RaxB